MPSIPRSVLEVLRDPVARDLLARAAKSIAENRDWSRELHWGRETGRPVLVDVPDIRPGDPPMAKLGDLVYVEYVTRKGHEPETVYCHDFERPKGSSFPGLYAAGDDLVIVRERSRYRVRKHGIIG